MEIAGRGSIDCTFQVEPNKFHTIQIDNIPHVPKFSSNLLSVGRLERNGMRVIFENGKATVWSGDIKVMVATRQGTMYPIHMRVNRPSQAMAVTATPENTLTLWHRQTGHASMKTLKDLAKREDSGIKLPGDEENEFWKPV